MFSDGRLGSVLKMIYTLYSFTNYGRPDLVITGLFFIPNFNGLCICDIYAHDMFGFESYGMLMYMK